MQLFPKIPALEPESYFNADQVHEGKRKLFSWCGGASRNVSRRAGVMDVTPSNVVVKAGLWNLLLWIDCHLTGRHNNMSHTQTLTFFRYSLVLSSSLIWDSGEHPRQTWARQKVGEPAQTGPKRSSSSQTLRTYFPGDTSVMSIHWQSMSAL